LNHGLKEAPELCYVYTIEAQGLFVGITIWHGFTMPVKQIYHREYIRMFYEIAPR
jgi:hypothetical protein